MTIEEKQLIENLFARLHQTEMDLPHRDKDVEKLIKGLLEKNQYAVYYMAQTILVQETVIKKLNDQISVLKNELSIKSEDNKVKNSSFLSSLFNINKKPKNLEKSSVTDCNNKDNPIPGTYKSNSNLNEGNNISSQSKAPLDRNNSSQNIGNSTYGGVSSGGGFLSGALQTAAGVAGGMVMANLLTNLFQHKRPEEEIMNQIHNVEPSQINDLNHNSQDVNNDLNGTNIDNTFKEEVVASDHEDNNYGSQSQHYDNSIIDQSNEEQYNSNNFNSNDDDNSFDDDNFM